MNCDRHGWRKWRYCRSKYLPRHNRRIYCRARTCGHRSLVPARPCSSALYPILATRLIHETRPAGQLKLFKIVPYDLVIGSSLCTWASERHGWRKCRSCRSNYRPSHNTSRDCPCLRLVVTIVNMVDSSSSDRGLTPHKFMPMTGVHQSLDASARRLAPHER
jgi:hypothetical protein